MGRAKSLELVAHRLGFSDCNRMPAVIGNGHPKCWTIGDKTSGKYLSQPFTGRMVSNSTLTPGCCQTKMINAKRLRPTFVGANSLARLPES